MRQYKDAISALFLEFINRISERQNKEITADVDDNNNNAAANERKSIFETQISHFNIQSLSFTFKRLETLK